MGVDAILIPHSGIVRIEAAPWRKVCAGRESRLTATRVESARRLGDALYDADATCSAGLFGAEKPTHRPR